MDVLIEITRSALSWPEGSKTRAVQLPTIERMVAKRREEVAAAEDLLERQWAWLGRNEGDQESDRYQQKLQVFASTLADYEDLVTGLGVADAYLRGAA